MQEKNAVTVGVRNRFLPIPLRSGRALSQPVLPVCAPAPDDAYGRKRGREIAAIPDRNAR